NGIAFIDSFLWEGRRYNLSLDLRLMPADRFLPIRGSDLHGWRIPEDAKLPLAIVRPKRSHFHEAKGARLISSEFAPWRSAWPVTGAQRIHKDAKYHELANGDFIADDDVSIVEAVHKMPGWA